MLRPQGNSFTVDSVCQGRVDHLPGFHELFVSDQGNFSGQYILALI
jgi:hypothetical protein